MTQDQRSRFRFFPALHALRGFSALWVLLYHVWVFADFYPRWAASFLSMGWGGVRVFFVLSAFLLGFQYFELRRLDRWNSRVFFKRRFLRIFPAYYAQLIVLLCVGWWFAVPWLQMPAEQILPHLLMYFHYPPGNVPPLNGVWWTLPVEFHFYLLMPLLAAALVRFGPWRLFVFAVLVTVGFRYIVYLELVDRPGQMMSSIMNQLPGLLVVFAAGLVGGWFASQGRLRRPGLSALVGLVGMAACTAWLLGLPNYWREGVSVFVWEIFFAVAVGLLVAGLYPNTHPLLANRTTRWLGNLSYGIYLWHLPLVLALRPVMPEITGDARFWMMLAIVLPVTLLLSWVSFVAVERPAMRLGRSPSRTVPGS